MSEDKKPDSSASPSWQTATTPPPTSHPVNSSTQEDAVDQTAEHETAETTIAISTTSTTEQEKLLELVNKFLQDPNVQHASVDRKMSFLTSKGLSKEQAEKALNASQATSSATNPTPPSPPDTALVESDAPLPEAASQTSHQQAQPSQLQLQPQQQQQPSSFPPIPPIITYPESLLPTHTSPPLVTPARLTTFAYFLTTFAATIYGTSTYLINPMLGALHSARHDFATNAQSNIDILNEKLAGIVSIDPNHHNHNHNHNYSKVSASTPENGEENEEKQGEDDTKTDSDEGDASLGKALFTFPEKTTTTTQSHSPTSTSSSPNSSTSPNPTTTTTTDAPNNSAENEIAALTNLSTLLSTTLSTQSDTDSTNSDVRKAVHELNDYLLGLASSAYSGRDSYYSGGGSVYGSGKEGEKEKKNDEVANIRKEIRGIKGMFVSGRKFPVPVPSMSVRR